MEKDEFLEHLIFALNSSHFKWCIPSSYRKLPYEVTSDVDIIVSEKPIHVIRYLVNYFLSIGSPWRIIHYHEGNNLYCIFGHHRSGELDLVHIDLMQHFYFSGRKLIDNHLFFSNNRQFQLIPIPSIPAEFIYIFLKKTLRLKATESDWNYLVKLYDSDKAQCHKLLEEYFNKTKSQQIIDMFENRQLQMYLDDLPSWQSLLLHNKATAYIGKNLLQFKKLANRTIHPSGFEIICLGPDGSGKSTSIKALEQSLSPVFKLEKYHLRSFPPKRYKGEISKSNFPYKQRKLNTIHSIAKLLGYLFLYWWGRIFVTTPQKLRSAFIIFDRSYHDVAIDPQRFRLNCPTYILQFYRALLPKPDLFLIFDSPAEVIQSRKQEVSFGETVLQRQSYHRFHYKNRFSFMIDTNKSQHQVRVELTELIVEKLSDRAIKRLKFKPNRKAEVAY